MNARGRPLKEMEKRRAQRLFVWMTAQEKAAVLKTAEESGLPIGEYTRRVLLSRKIVPKADHQALQDLRRASDTLRTIAREHPAGQGQDWTDILQELTAAAHRIG